MNPLADPSAVELTSEEAIAAAVVGVGTLAFGSFCFVFVLRLFRQGPRPDLTSDSSVVFLGLGAFFVLQWFAAMAAVLLVPFPDGTVTTSMARVLAALFVAMPVQVALTGAAMLLGAAGMWRLPSLYGGDPIRAFGIGSLRRGFLTALAVAPFVYAAYFGITLLWLLAMRAFGHVPESQTSVLLFAWLVEWRAWPSVIALLVMIVVVAPLVEELLFRGILYRNLATRFGPVLAAIVSGVFFGVIHMNWAGLLPLSALGIALALLYERTGNLWSSILLHAVFNAGQITALLIALM